MAEKKYIVSSSQLAQVVSQKAFGAHSPRVPQKDIAEILDVSPMTISKRVSEGWTAGQLIELAEAVGFDTLHALSIFGVLELPPDKSAVIEVTLSGTAEEIQRLLGGRSVEHL